MCFEIKIWGKYPIAHRYLRVSKCLGHILRMDGTGGLWYGWAPIPLKTHFLLFLFTVSHIFLDNVLMGHSVANCKC